MGLGTQGRRGPKYFLIKFLYSTTCDFLAQSEVTLVCWAKFLPQPVQTQRRREKQELLLDSTPDSDSASQRAPAPQTIGLGDSHPRPAVPLPVRPVLLLASGPRSETLHQLRHWAHGQRASEPSLRRPHRRRRPIPRRVRRRLPLRLRWYLILHLSPFLFGYFFRSRF